MKKLALTLVIVLTMGLGAFAQYGDGSMLGRSGILDGYRQTGDPTTPFIPYQHGLTEDVNGEESPLGSGIALLIGLGGAYLVAKKRKGE